MILRELSFRGTPLAVVEQHHLVVNTVVPLFGIFAQMDAMQKLQPFFQHLFGALPADGK